MDFRPEYETQLDVRGAHGIKMAQWVLSNLSANDVADVHIRIEVEGETVEMDELESSSSTNPKVVPVNATDRNYESPEADMRGVTTGSRAHKALALLDHYADEHADDPWVDTGTLYDFASAAQHFRDKQDLSAALSILFNEKALTVQSDIPASIGKYHQLTVGAKSDVLATHPDPL